MVLCSFLFNASWLLLISWLCENLVETCSTNYAIILLTHSHPLNMYFVCVESGNKTSDTDLDGVLIEWKPWRKGSSWRKSRCIVGGQQRFDTDWRWLQSCRGVDWWWIWCRSWWHFEVQWVVDVGIVLSLCFVCYFFCLFACMLELCASVSILRRMPGQRRMRRYRQRVQKS